MTHKLNIILGYFLFCMISTSSCDGSDSIDAVETLGVGKEIWQIQYGIVDGKLSYLVFDGPRDLPFKNRVKISSSSSFRSLTKENKEVKRSATIDYPDGRKVELARSGRILFVSKGKFTEIKLHITPKILEEFLDSDPMQITSDSLKEFVKAKAVPVGERE